MFLKNPVTPTRTQKSVVKNVQIYANTEIGVTRLSWIKNV